MAFIHSPKIVTDGLFLALDGANIKSYPQTGTVWSNLTQDTRLDAVLVNGPIYDSANNGTVSFDGTGDNAFINDVGGSIRPTSANNYTVGCWVYMNTTQNYATFSYKNILTKNGRNTTELRALPYNMVYQSSSAQLEISVHDGTNRNTLSMPFQTNAWNHIMACFSWSTTTLITYLNGVPYTTALTVPSSISNSTDPEFMRASGINNFTGGRLAQVLMYNKALSANEILQNFNATRGRFGV
jgi:hypothetical protein